jgi:long-chain fatty acid transport protein
MNNPHFGESTYKSLGCLVKVLPGVAYQVNDQLSIGATLGVAFSQAELEGPFYPNSLPLAGVPTKFDLLANGVAPTGSVGLQYKLTPRTTIGACYTEETRFRLDGTVRADVMVAAPPVPPISSNFDAEVDLVWPRSFGVGFRHEVCECRRFSADVIWYDWSHAFDELDIKLTNSSHPAFAAFGPQLRDSLPMDWEDSVSIRLGYEWEPVAANIFRAGYVFHNSPVSDSTLNPYLDGVLTHALSAGYSRQYERYVLNAAYQYSFSPEREIEASQLAGGDFNDSKFSAEAHWMSLSLLVPF